MRASLMPEIISVCNLPPVPNVCNQELREIFRSPQLSIAHVLMQPDALSLLHEHHRMNEGYLVLAGEGVLQAGETSRMLSFLGYQYLPPFTPHRLRTTGAQRLEHLVFATPPFIPEDVHLLEETRTWPLVTEASPLPFTWFSAADGAEVTSLDTETERTAAGYGLAYGILKPGRKAIPHYHRTTQELYYVLAGRGKVLISGTSKPVSKGSLIYLPTRTVHGLDNREGTEPLQVLCVSYPPYSDSDHIAV
ncbi:cupin domain-containing protein [Candidatus Pacearchaeota archaeon]|nr:cupin domain-containing protein [Candidatus Pacearchaeota archaeon]